jgi:hypothetical protein
LVDAIRDREARENGIRKVEAYHYTVDCIDVNV